MTNVRLQLIIGQGGTRLDYVSGWLSTLPGYIDNEWNFDSVTGQSKGYQQLVKALDYDTLDDVLSRNDLTLNKHNSIIWAGGCHGHQIDKYIQHIQDGSISVAVIDVTEEDLIKITWERIVKTWCHQHRGFGVLKGYQRKWHIDDYHERVLSNQERIEFVEKLLYANPSNDPGIIKYNYDFPHVKLNYNELFKPSGSHTLCKLLGINSATNRHHLHWDSCLPLADSPTEISVWNHTFIKDNYFAE